MIRLQEVKLTDGTIYRNLYYESSWEELKFICEVCENIPFFKRGAKKWDSILIKPEEIREIIQDEEFHGENFDFVKNNEEGGITLYSSPLIDEYLDEIENETIFGQIDDFCSLYLDGILEEFNLEDANEISDKMSAIIVGYMQTSVEQTDKRESDSILFVQGVSLALLAAAFLCEKLDADINTPELRKDAIALTKDYCDYVAKATEPKE